MPIPTTTSNSPILAVASLAVNTTDDYSAERDLTGDYVIIDYPNPLTPPAPWRQGPVLR